MCSQFIFPKPRDWETFEDITADLLKRKYQSPNLQRFGRRGQEQWGIDIVGPTKTGLLGAQCKHHTEANIPVSEIEAAIKKADQFPHPLHELIIATSASRDSNAQSRVLALSESRKAIGAWPVSIVFWEDVVEWLEEYPDLLYKHFTKHFPPDGFERVKFPSLNPKKQSVSWPTSLESVRGVVSANLSGLDQVDPYQLVLGVTSFPSARFAGLVDIDVPLQPSLSEEAASECFLADVEALRELRSTISGPEFSREPLVHLQTRLSASFLFGWMFRRVTGFSPQFIVGNELWVTNGLPSTGNGLSEALPIFCSTDSREVVLVLSMSRRIGTQVLSSVEDWPQKPYAIIELVLEGNSIRGAGQALSIAKEISWRIKTYADQWQAVRLHLFAAIPTTLAALIGTHLNAICPIDLYFLSSDRSRYLPAGTITNNLGSETWPS